MPSACVDRLIAMLRDAKSRVQPPASPAPQPSPEPAPAPQPADSPQPSEPAAALQPNQVRVTVPKTWGITADARRRLVIVVFDHLAETRSGYALDPDAARKMSEGLAKNAGAVQANKGSAAGSESIILPAGARPTSGKS